MKAFRIRVEVLGRSLLDVELGEPVTPAAPAAVETPAGNDPGPVTERRGGPVLGFAPPKPAARRAAGNDPPVVR